MDNNWIDDFKWNILLEEIRIGKCILVVGPDLVSFDDSKTLFQKLVRDLKLDSETQGEVDLDPGFIFEHEELLQLQPGKGDTSLLMFYREFYKRRTEFDAPFAKIAQMPFHTIISLLPDDRLRATFEKMNRAHEFSYYPPINPPNAVSKPTQDNPLIYNIIGSTESYETVITFDHLFDYLKGILGARSLPVQLEKTLKEAKSFIFLGVHFEKWYLQVMLRVLLPQVSASGTISKYTILKKEQSNDVRTFIARRLQLDFKTIEPLDFLNELYDRLQARELLINPPKPTLATVFVSYSHTDATKARRLAAALQAAEIEIIMDEAVMPVGEKIRRFMTRVLDVDAVVALISEHSMQSPWVGKEVMYSIQKDIQLVPCFLDKRFDETGVVEVGETLVRAKLLTINRLISERKQKDLFDSARDLTEEEELWREFGKNLPELIAEIKGRKAISLLPDDWGTGVRQVVATILANR
ncbi:toll/interleukin-1 receptor domain-containing protein [Dyadobacter fanqingshengii]|uniref:Toll/interleukin-1 receptor domain-containing protein n=1 Tax=Dyadobacter fanqingshengii TaxID=2906443 RepID=A0A9X1TFQ6_9BACT|nr:toll/interleukin-1 receptor domain-containing protein [Dyadobacter fanqingshengii]MCF0039742.1 toll/interleukin-1 receptor domain-containing protein [Dyadobacter fanqingshengii]USJ38496.1 toll/interleukin-1 receptor domain-containing protein [Dyadobacter fanqingshengii]